MPSHSRSCGYVSISLSFGNRLNTSKLKSLKIHQKKTDGANDNETKRLLWHMQCANHFVMCRVDECVSRMNKYENNHKSQMTARHAQMIFASVADVNYMKVNKRIIMYKWTWVGSWVLCHCLLLLHFFHLFLSGFLVLLFFLKLLLSCSA